MVALSGWSRALASCPDDLAAPACQVCAQACTPAHVFGMHVLRHVLGHKHKHILEHVLWNMLEHLPLGIPQNTYPRTRFTKLNEDHA